MVEVARPIDLADARDQDGWPAAERVQSPYDPEAPVLDAVTCRIAISHTVTVPRVSADIRDRVIAVLSRHVSVDPGAVNIVVEDVYDA